jgi:hypothetical protein
MARTQRQRDDDARREKLERIDEQLREGSLTIRTMTEAERERWAQQRAKREAERSPADTRRAEAAERRRRRRAARSAG